MRLALPAALVALGLSACDPQRVEETSAEVFRFEAGSERPRIEVRIEDGSVEIQGIQGSRAIEAEFLKRARSVDRETARGLLSRIEVSALQSGEGAPIRFEGRVESIPPFGGDLRTDLSLRLPREADVEIVTRDGRIQIEGIEGRVRAESGDGRIFVERASGELRLRTEDGSIVGRELDGSLEAATGDGDIEIDGSFARLEATTGDGSIRIDGNDWPASTEGWVVRTADGAIRVLLPSSAAAEIDATASDGRIVNRLRSFDGAGREQTDNRLRGKLGGGGSLLFFSTMDGRIELEQK
jgi:hypothetical protein